MFTDLFRIIADYGLAVPAEIAAIFRALATIEGTLATQLAPGFDIAAEARRFGEQQLAAQLSPEAVRQTAADDLAMLVPMLRRLPRRIDRLGGALEDGRLTVSVRLLADPSDRRYLTGMLDRVLLAFLAAAAGIMAVLMIGLHAVAVSKTVSLYSFFGYCLLVIAAILAVRVLVQVFRPVTGRRRRAAASVGARDAFAHTLSRTAPPEGVRYRAAREARGRSWTSAATTRPRAAITLEADLEGVRVGAAGGAW